MASILKVDQINDRTNNNKAIEVDSSGRVTLPQLPHVRVGGTNDAYVAHSANDKIKFNTVVNGVASMYDTSDYEFTVPIDGTYVLTSNVLTDGANTSHIDVFVNGTRRFRGGASATSERMFNISVVEELNANDTVYFAVTAADSYYMDEVHSWATMTLIG